MKLPSKIEYKRYDIVEKYNELVDFLEYFIRETNPCCSCNGCARHPNKIEVEEETLAQKFQMFRAHQTSGKGKAYWSGLQKIAEEHFKV